MSMPQDFWAEGVRYYVDLLNRVQTKALKEITPYEAIKGKRPDLKHLRIFGCVGHVKVTNPGLKKLDDRSMPMVYLGVEEGTKAYRMYDAINKKIVVHRDVKFKEARNWDWSNYLNEVNDGTPSWVKFMVTDDNFQSVGGEPHVHNENEVGPAPELEPVQADQATTSQSVSGSCQVELRKSSRTFVLSSRLSDFVLDGNVRYGTGRQDDLNLVELLVIEEGEPMSYIEAVKEKVCRHAIDEEIEAIEKNKTWILITDPPLKCLTIVDSRIRRKTLSRLLGYSKTNNLLFAMFDSDYCMNTLCDFV
ncbi:uncharacterized protein LOC143585090 [Bidens hawaiensis]|uniref:uncharacterized protein LOC143585090 n=1 Tax=Bidens hawaiensis TaxID=980011 RepID=UPI004049397C